MPRKLSDGVYEHLVTDELERGLAQLDTDVQRAIEGLADTDGHLTLARHLGQEVARALESIPLKERVEAGRQLVSRLIGELTSLPGIDRDSVAEQRIPAPPRRLLAIHRGAAPERPATPLTISTLLTRNRAEPSLGHELGREIAIADRIDAVVAFVTVSGVRAIREALETFARRGDGLRLRLLTTTFQGITEVEALDQLASLPGAQVKVSYDVRRTRLHAKAWLFHRESGLTTAYVGSANLTATALGGGQEWMVKLCAADLPHVTSKFEGTFETLWQDPEFEPYDPRSDAHRIRLQAALGAERNAGPETALTLLSLRPYPYQEEILDRLAAERTVHNRRRNLIVAATGTGKTVIAAFDYARVADGVGVRPRLLFLAHRREILVQARDTFRHALHDAAFGELLTGNDEAERFEHVFATIQSALSARLLERFGAGHFRHVIVDECHHVPAASYQAIVPHVTPDILVGLTATPERTDGQSLLPDFDGHIAAELRLWHALDRQLLVPFEYFGLSDGVDLRHVHWTRHGYDVGELAAVYSGHNARAGLVLHQLKQRVAELRRVRALGFCVSVEHAEFMTAQFNAAGVPALAVHGGTPEDVRADAPRRLRERLVNVLFTCDLYNEGVDLPFVDTLLLLRPTMSATLFMQQLGRGLRIHDKKASCLVLDFIGQHREEFRFDAVLSALTGAPRARLRTAVEEGFPYLPSGCTLQLDAVARDTILHSLRGTLAGAQRLAAELRELATAGPVSLRRFLEETGRELEDVYDPDNYGWTKLRRLAGLQAVDEETEDLSRRLGRLTHVDDPSRLRAYRDLVAIAGSAQPFAPSDTDRVRMHMLEFQLSHQGVMRTAEESARYLAARPSIVDEMEQLREILEDRAALAEEVYPIPEWPLALHHHYSRREILAAVGFVKPGERGVTPQSGVLKLEDVKRELLFVTLDKSGRGFSPATRYRDFAISPQVFHWETQSIASASRPSGRRYIESAENGWSFYLFVRTNPHAAYSFLGQARYQSHAGDRPIAITWRLDHAMPAGLFELYATLAAH